MIGKGAARGGDGGCSRATNEGQGKIAQGGKELRRVADTQRGMVFVGNKGPFLLEFTDRGRAGAGNIGIHSQKKRHHRCTTCGDTFSATTGTPYDRLHKDAWLMTVVLILLTHGCPPPAIVAAFGLDERIVSAWLHRAGAHGTAVQGRLVEAVQVEGGRCKPTRSVSSCATACW